MLCRLLIYDQSTLKFTVNYNWHQDMSSQKITYFNITSFIFRYGSFSFHLNCFSRNILLVTFIVLLYHGPNYLLWFGSTFMFFYYFILLNTLKWTQTTLVQILTQTKKPRQRLKNRELNGDKILRFSRVNFESFIVLVAVYIFSCEYSQNLNSRICKELPGNRKVVSKLSLS